MSEPIDALAALRTEVDPVVPDPAFTARLREDLRRAVLRPPGGEMTTTTPATQNTAAQDTVAPVATALTPYLSVRDARQAIAWYGEVFGAELQGPPYVMSDGAVGHAELAIGGTLLMLAEQSADYPDHPAAPPVPGASFSHSLHLTVSEVDTVVSRARDGGARIEREPTDLPYGRTAVFVDPFDHRWMLNTPPPAEVAPPEPAVGGVGGIAYTTMVVTDVERAKAFYGAVLGWEFEPGGTPGGWAVAGREDVGLWGAADATPEAQLCFQVADIDEATGRVRDAGGQAGEVQAKPYGRLVECVDDAGTRFQLFQE